MGRRQVWSAQAGKVTLSENLTSKRVVSVDYEFFFGLAFFLRFSSNQWSERALNS